MTQDVQKVSGVGPKAAERLKDANISTAEELAGSTAEMLMDVGFTENRANKFIEAANLLVKSVGSKPVAPKASTEVEEEPEDIKVEEVEEDTQKTKPKRAPKKKSKKPASEEELEEVVEEKPKKAPKKKVEEEPEEVVEEKPKKTPKKKKVEDEPEEIVEEKPKKTPKKKKVEDEPKKSTKTKDSLREDQRSPRPKGIPTKKKRGVQVRSLTEEEAEFQRVEKRETGWAVQAKALSEEEREEKRRRLDEMNKAAKITRPIPTKPEPIKATKKAKKAKSDRPVKIEKTSKVVEKKAKMERVIIDYYTMDDIKAEEFQPKRRGVAANKSGVIKPRAELKKGTEIGTISSVRRSRRVLHERQLIVDLSIDMAPDSLVGQKVYFIYPDNEMKVAGSIAKRFGKASSGKVLVNFKKGIRPEAMAQKIFIK
ncbi:MAG: hypothetical protein INQ03_16780 [Candidatus Heimdallarchaeota archaeon]|nr:hypothetical protein [Candidatus Heimdallarchaeota archaeon]